MNGNSGKTQTLIWVTLLIAVVVIGIGYAAISTITLNIKGSASATTNNDNFVVEFDNATDVSTSGNNVTAQITDVHNATINVTGLTKKGDTAYATYTIKNSSEAISAILTATTTNENEDYFKVDYEFANDGTTTTLEADNSTTIKVTVELIKTPIEDIPETNIGVTLTATPTQPNE